MENDADTKQPDASADPAALAFEALREEVALVRRAVTGLAAERTAIEIPDYSETLGQIMRTSAATTNSLKVLAEMPALRLMAKDWGREIAAASGEARRADGEMFERAVEALQQATHNVTVSLRSARSAENQRQWLLWTAASGVVAGMLLWAVGAAPVARAMPESWYWPERMAASIVGMDQENAGAHLIATAAPDRWRDIVLGYRIVNDNRDTIARCETAAAKEPKPVRCMIEIGDRIKQ